MTENTIKLLFLSLQHIVCQELFNHKLYLSLESTFELGSKLSKSSLNSIKTSKQPRQRKANQKQEKPDKPMVDEPLKDYLKKKFSIDFLDETDSTKENSRLLNENPVERSKPKKGLKRNYKFKNLDEPSSPETEDEQADNSVYRLIEDQEIEDDRMFLQEYAKIYKQKYRSIPKKRKNRGIHQDVEPQKKKIGKDREKIVALGNEINIYKKTQFIEEEVDAAKKLIENIDNFPQKLKAKKKVVLIIDNPRVFYLAIPV